MNKNSNIQQLISDLKSPDWGVAAHAAQTLGELGVGARKAVPALIDALLGGDDWVAIDAAKALGKIGDSRANEALLKTLVAADWRRIFEDAVERAQADPTRRQYVTMIGEGLGMGILQLQYNSIHALEQIGDKSIVPKLIELLNSDDVDLPKLDIVSTLATFKAEEAVPTLINMLEKQSKNLIYWMSCDALAEALMKIGTAEAVTAAEKWRAIRPTSDQWWAK
jgi:HEAT repeat protein